MCLGLVVFLSTFITSPSTCSPSVGSPSHPPLCSHPSYQPGSGESGSIALEKKCGWELWFLFLPFFLIIPISKFPQALALAVHPAVMLFHPFKLSGSSHFIWSPGSLFKCSSPCVMVCEYHHDPNLL